MVGNLCHEKSFLIKITNSEKLFHEPNQPNKPQTTLFIWEIRKDGTIRIRIVFCSLAYMLRDVILPLPYFGIIFGNEPTRRNIYIEI